MNYNDYLEIEDFPSEINPDSIKEMETVDPDWWIKTYPHKTFIELLKATEAMLSRQTYKSKKSLWVQGSYGTGKSRIVSTLKKLLDCSDEDFNKYFDNYKKELKSESDLRTKLLAQRSHGKIITAYRYSSGEITDFNDFIMVIYEEVSKALKAANVPYAGENTLRGGIINWLGKSVNKKYFNELISQPAYRSSASLSGNTADEILSKLNNPNANVQDLIRDILVVAKNEGISVLSKKMEDAKKWLTDIIDQNHLKAIVFFWDEFSEFFRKNKNYLDTFQSFNELSNNKPFNMVIVTHSAIFEEGDPDGEKVRDRFNEHQIELPDTIAFDLIDHVIKVKDTQKEIWKKKIETIQDGIVEACTAVAEFVWKNDAREGIEELNGILPIHPLAALLLKHISERFASNQRSMFNFIKNDDPDGLEAFQWFIKTHSPDGSLNEDDSLLTIDYLWNFFYEKGTDEHTSAVGRSNLDTQIRSILDSYAQNEGMLNNDQKRVLKTVLMLQAMSEKLRYQFPLFLPTEENIELAYNGLMWQGGKAKGIAQRLVQDNILFKKKVVNGTEVFAATVVSSDTAKIEEKIEKLRSLIDTDALITDGDLKSVISLTKAQEFRFKIFTLTWNNFTSEVNKIANEPASKDIKPFQIPLVMFFAKTSEERSKLQKSLKEKLAEFNNNQDDNTKKIVFLDLTAANLPDDQFEQYLEYKAQEEYYRPTDKSQADNYDRYAKNILKEWKDNIANAVQTVYSCDKPNGNNCQSSSERIDALNEIVRMRYSNSFDNVMLTNQMWVNSKPKDCLKLGIDLLSKGIDRNIVGFIENNKSTFETLKADLDGYIREQLREGRIAVSALFDHLIENGFMPCNAYAYLTGWLLRDYANGQYRYSDGEPGNSKRMENEQLATIVSNAIKQKETPSQNYKDWYIELLSPEQKAFVDLAHSVWDDIADDLSVELITTEIRSKLMNLNYPLWAFKELDCHGADEFLIKLSSLANVKNDEDKSSVESKIVNELGKMTLQNQGFGQILKSLLTPENAEEAMRRFLERFENGILLRLAKEIHVSNVLYDVKKAFNGNGLWLWNQETGEDVVIRGLINKYKFVVLSNKVLPNSATSYLEALHNWDEKIKSIRIPYLTIVQKRPAVKSLLKFFFDRYENELPDNRVSDLVATLEQSLQGFKEFDEQKISIFKEAFSFQLGDLSDDDVWKVYSQLQGDVFYKTTPEVQTLITLEVQSIIDEQLYNKLQELWQEKTGTETPYAWSEKYRTPILAMVPKNELYNARNAFGAINNQRNPDPSKVQDAINYLKGNHEYFNDLNDQVKIDEAFMIKIIRDYRVLLDNPDVVRDKLQRSCSTNCYTWLDDHDVTEFVNQMGASEYANQGLTKVQEKVEQMDDQQVKALLMWLVNNSPETGIKILIDYEGI